MDFEVGAGFEVADFFLALDEDGEGRSLDASHRGDLEAAEEFLVEGGHGAGAIDTDEPVAFGAAGGGLAERDHFGVVSQGGEALADGVGGHGLQPEAFDRFLVFEMLGNVTKDEFAFASGIAGIDHFADVFAGEEFFQDAKLVLGLFAGDEVEVGGEDGEIFEGPFAADDFEAVGLLDFEKVTHGV